MLTGVTIANFKAISDSVRLELRPITLLFGQNSAGKSSLLHALVYAREVFERHNLDADHTLSGGDCLDLGGFRSLVHGQDLRRAVRLQFELDLSDIDLPGAADPELDGEMDDEFNQLGSRVRDAVVSVLVGWSELDSRPYVGEYSVEINGRFFARLVCDAPRKGVRIAMLDTLHPVMGGLEPAVPHSLDEPWPYLHELLDSVRDYILPVGEEGAIGILGHAEALPNPEVTSGPFRFPVAVEYPPPPSGGVGLREYQDKMRRLITVERILYMFLAGPVVLLRDALMDFRYIGPLRQVPPREYVPPRRVEPAHWANGMAGWELLFGRPDLVERISRLLADPRRLDLGYTLDLVEFREFESHDPLLVAFRTNRADDVEDVEGRLRKVKTRTRLLFRPLDTPDMTLEPADVGVGVSQMIPILAAALDDQPLGTATLPAQLVAVEHPELNLHPRLQAEIADVFLEGALSEATRGRIFFIETHSEVLPLRLFRRVRDWTRKQAAASGENPEEGEDTGPAAPGSETPGDSQDGGPWEIAVKPTDVGVWYVDRRGGPVTVRRVPVDVEGEFIQPWPEDDTLFEQDFRERYT